MLGRPGEDLRVLPTSSILNYSAGVDPAQVCRDVGVRHTLQGNVQKIGALWRVSIQIFDSTSQKISFSEKHDFKMENVFELQDEIGRRVVESLRTRFSLALPKSRDRYSSEPEAYNEFMAGLRESHSDKAETLKRAPSVICPRPSSTILNLPWRTPGYPTFWSTCTIPSILSAAVWRRPSITAALL